jgi:3-isopropylmalate dehydratase small subunit
MATVANILYDRKVAPGVVLKIVPATDEIWQRCLNEGFIDIFKSAGALVSNAGCAGCAAGQVGQNGAGEVTISTGNRNFPGKQGKGDVYLASPAIVAASAIAGFITTPEGIPDEPLTYVSSFQRDSSDLKPATAAAGLRKVPAPDKPVEVEGHIWYIREDNIDTDMIFHNRYLAITDSKEMGQYTFDNLKGYQDFAKKAQKGDIVIVQKNFGSGSSRQQAVDCFLSLGIHCVLAESFGAIYERNAINAAFPIITYSSLEGLDLVEDDVIRVNYETGVITSLKSNTSIQADPFSEVQLEIFKRGGLF